MMKVYSVTVDGFYNYYFTLALVLIALLVSACGKSPSPSGLPNHNTVEPDIREVEMILPGHDEPTKVTYEVINGLAIFEGDIILGTEEEINALSVQGIGLSNVNHLWPNGIVPYEIFSSVSSDARRHINEAIAHWEERTNIDFIDRTDETEYVIFANGSICSSNVGRTGRGVFIYLKEGDCSRGTLIHEIGHAIGLYHEQSRSDRDKYVRILYENIKDRFSNQFRIIGSNSNDLGPYDFDSIMHYGNKALSKNGQPTIETIPPGIPIGQRDGLSDGDLFAVCKLYRGQSSPGVLKDFGAGNDAGCWRTDSHPRLLGDVNGDGRDDIVGFDEEGVKVSLANSTDFSYPPELWIQDFGYNAGDWRVDRHPRFLADVDGDGRQDIVGFGEDGVLVSLSTGSSFSSSELWSTAFGADISAGGWQVGVHPRFLADVDGDGRQDVVGFGHFGVVVALSTGSSFASPELWVAAFGADGSVGGWQVGVHPRFLADVDGDGRQDVVGFGHFGVVVALSTGSSFASPSLWSGAFGADISAGGWQVGVHPRLLADVDGDSRQDVVGFGHFGVVVALSTGSSFASPELWVAAFGADGSVGGWQVGVHPRLLADVNGDGKQDVVGFGSLGTDVAFSTGSNFQPSRWVNAYGAGASAGGWQVENHPRLLGDISGDGKADIVGFGHFNVAFTYSEF